MIILTISLFGLISLFSFLNYKQKTTKIFFLFAVLFLFLLAAFRDGSTVRDYGTYVAMYNNEKNISIVEISFSLITRIVKYVFLNNVLFLFIIYAMLSVVIKVKAIKELTSLYFLSLVIYISNFYILHELTQIRVGVASGFILLCIKPIYERDFRKFLLFAICAVFFHYSALIIFLLWFFKGNNINKYAYVAIILIAYVFYFLRINLVELIIQFIPIKYIQQKYDGYVEVHKWDDNYTRINVFNSVFLVKILIYYVLLWKSKLIEIQNKYVNLLLRVEALALTSFILFSAMPVFAFRISDLLGIVEIILIPFIYYIFKPRSLSNAIVVFIGLCLLLINIFYVNLIIS